MPKKKLSTVRSLTHFTRDEIILLFKSARTKYRTAGIEIRCAPKWGSLAKLLIVTPRACGNAVERNLIRRRLKHIFYQEQLFDQPYSCIILVKKQAHAFSFDQLKTIMRSALVC